MITLFSETNVIAVISAAFFVCILAGVFRIQRTTEKMGDDKK